ncbi:DUF4870 domain-containing protein [Patescibacteria group bacterium]|nr:DUF4870 domain-containing protein [Patescibacteria group bacterium]
MEQETIKTPDAKDVEENQGLSYLSYISIFFLIPLLAKKDSPFAQFHAKQGMTLVIMVIAVFIGIMIVGFVPFIGPIISFLTWFATIIFAIVCVIMGLVNVSKGVMKPLPLIGQFAEKIKF